MKGQTLTGSMWWTRGTLALFILTGAPPLASQEVSIEGRQECEPGLYARSTPSFAEAIDSAAAAALILQFRDNRTDPINIHLRYEFQGAPRELEVSGEKYQPADRARLAAALRPLMRSVPPRNDRFTLTVFLVGTPVEFVVHPDQLTCPSALIDRRSVAEAFARAMRQLRNNGIVDQSSHGMARVSFVIRETGQVTGLVIEQSSGQPGIDSAAVNAVSRARYRPAVSGRRAIAVGGSLLLEY